MTMVSLSPMHLVLEQANLFDSGGLLACGFSEERLPHQVCLGGFWSSLLPDAEEGRVRGRGRLHLLHLHTLRVLLCLLLKGRCWYRSSPSIWKRNRSGNGYLLVLHPSNEWMREWEMVLMTVLCMAGSFLCYRIDWSVYCLVFVVLLKESLLPFCV